MQPAIRRNQAKRRIDGRQAPNPSPRTPVRPPFVGRPVASRVLLAYGSAARSLGSIATHPISAALRPVGRDKQSEGIRAGPSPGTWQLTAVLSGDGNNAGSSSGCGAEPVTVNQARPTLSTAPHPPSAPAGSHSCSRRAIVEEAPPFCYVYSAHARVRAAPARRQRAAPSRERRSRGAPSSERRSRRESAVRRQR